jgi:hypothetical protein
MAETRKQEDLNIWKYLDYIYLLRLYTLQENAIFWGSFMPVRLHPHFHLNWSILNEGNE